MNNVERQELRDEREIEIIIKQFNAIEFSTLFTPIYYKDL